MFSGAVSLEKCLAKLVSAELPSPLVSVALPATRAAPAADQDHPAAAAGPEPGEGGAAAAHIGQRLAAQPLHQLIVGQALERPADGGRGIVHQHIQPAESLARRVDGAGAALGGEEVGPDRTGTHAERLDLAIHPGERRFVAADDGDVGTLVSEGQGDRPPDAPVAAGDDDGLAVQCQVHVAILPARTSSPCRPRSSAAGRRRSGGSSPGTPGSAARRGAVPPPRRAA